MLVPFPAFPHLVVLIDFTLSLNFILNHRLVRRFLWLPIMYCSLQLLHMSSWKSFRSWSYSCRKPSTSSLGRHRLFKTVLPCLCSPPILRWYSNTLRLGSRLSRAGHRSVTASIRITLILTVFAGNDGGVLEGSC